VAQETFAEADEILGFSLSDLCFHGPEADLNATVNTQPALYVAGIAALRVINTALPDLKPFALAGHSLGEFTALTAAGALSFADGLRLVRERGRLMAEAGEQQPGGMAALLGLDADVVRAVCQQASAETGAVVVLANDNCPGQIVISGQYAALERALELAKAAGAKRAVKLAVSIAAHSPLMMSASQAFEEALSRTAFSDPQVTVYANVTAQPVTSVDAIRAELGQQLTSSVRWTESVRAMIAAGVTEFVELGARDVLTGLLKRIDTNVRGSAIYDAATLATFVTART
ncbi:MAG: ACP S-malonyltransferase, partial [Anaerolinea sp.]|nr:ACP S-malonyltransferase [Anaerolinea sp.]